ncbi:MAG: PilX N-terminal domain-containing pilus assembly protein [Steroidobacteraceae bacterium]
MHTSLNSPQRQSGAALVVALILLVALSLMAISSMNTASLDLIMAGNEQYRSRSFVAAEAGIERAWKGDNATHYRSDADYSQASVGTGSGSDAYSYEIKRPNNGKEENAPEFNSMNEGQLKKITFRIISTGSSERGTRSRNTQELYKVIKAPDSITRDADCGTASLDTTTSTC